MKNSNLRLAALDLRQANECELAALNRFQNLMQAERLPDEPPIPLVETIGDYQNLPAVYKNPAWVIWRDGELVAKGECWFKTTDDNRHLLSMDLGVLPTYRRQGLATQLLAPLAETAVREERRLMLTHSYARVPAGESLLRQLDAQMGLASHTNQLDLRELDRALVARWIAQASERAADFELVFIAGACSDEQLATIAALTNSMNDAPRGTLEMDDWQTTPEQVRQFEQYLVGMGKQLWTLLVRHVPSGEFAGFTQTAWSPERPTMLEQWRTSVVPSYRNRGLGRWLKAAMLEKAPREWPALQFVRTSNADSNAPMLKINHELGFKPYESVYTWQIETKKVQDYLSARDQAVRARK